MSCHSPPFPTHSIVIIIVIFIVITSTFSQIFSDDIPGIAHPPNEIHYDKRYGVNMGPGNELFTGDVIVLTVEDISPIDQSPVFNVWAQNDNGDIICIDPIESASEQYQQSQIPQVQQSGPNYINPGTQQVYQQYGYTTPSYSVQYYAQAWQPSLLHMFYVTIVDGRLGLFTLSPLVVFPSSPKYISPQPNLARSGVASSMTTFSWTDQSPHKLSVNQYIPPGSNFMAYAAAQYTGYPSDTGSVFIRGSLRHGYCACSNGQVLCPKLPEASLIFPDLLTPNVDPIFSKFKVNKIPSQVARQLMANYIDAVTAGQPRTFIMLTSSPLTDRVAAVHYHTAEAFLSARRLYAGRVSISTHGTKLEQQLSSLLRSLISDSIRFSWTFQASIEPFLALGVFPVVEPIDSGSTLSYQSRDDQNNPNNYAVFNKKDVNIKKTTFSTRLSDTDRVEDINSEDLGYVYNPYDEYYDFNSQNTPEMQYNNIIREHHIDLPPILHDYDEKTSKKQKKLDFTKFPQIKVNVVPRFDSKQFDVADPSEYYSRVTDPDYLHLLQEMHENEQSLSNATDIGTTPQPLQFSNNRKNGAMNNNRRDILMTESMIKRSYEGSDITYDQKAQLLDNYEKNEVLSKIDEMRTNGTLPSQIREKWVKNHETERDYSWFNDRGKKYRNILTKLGYEQDWIKFNFDQIKLQSTKPTNSSISQDLEKMGYDINAKNKPPLLTPEKYKNTVDLTTLLDKDPNDVENIRNYWNINKKDTIAKNIRESMSQRHFEFYFPSQKSENNQNDPHHQQSQRFLSHEDVKEALNTPLDEALVVDPQTRENANNGYKNAQNVNLLNFLLQYVIFAYNAQNDQNLPNFNLFKQKQSNLGQKKLNIAQNYQNMKHLQKLFQLSDCVEIHHISLHRLADDNNGRFSDNDEKHVSSHQNMVNNRTNFTKNFPNPNFSRVETMFFEWKNVCYTKYYSNDMKNDLNTILSPLLTIFSPILNNSARNNARDDIIETVDSIIIHNFIQNPPNSPELVSKINISAKINEMQYKLAYLMALLYYSSNQHNDAVSLIDTQLFSPTSSQLNNNEINHKNMFKNNTYGPNINIFQSSARNVPKTDEDPLESQKINEKGQKDDFSTRFRGRYSAPKTIYGPSNSVIRDYIHNKHSELHRKSAVSLNSTDNADNVLKSAFNTPSPFFSQASHLSGDDIIDIRHLINLKTTTTEISKKSGNPEKPFFPSESLQNSPTTATLRKDNLGINPIDLIQSHPIPETPAPIIELQNQPLKKLKTLQVIPGLLNSMALSAELSVVGGTDSDFGTVAEIVGEYALLAPQRASNIGHLIQHVTYSSMPFSIDLQRYGFYWTGDLIALSHIQQSADGLDGVSAFSHAFDHLLTLSPSVLNVKNNHKMSTMNIDASQIYGNLTGTNHHHSNIFTKRNDKIQNFFDQITMLPICSILDLPIKNTHYDNMTTFTTKPDSSIIPRPKTTETRSNPITQRFVCIPSHEFNEFQRNQQIIHNTLKSSNNSTEERHIQDTLFAKHDYMYPHHHNTPLRLEKRAKLQDAKKKFTQHLLNTKITTGSYKPYKYPNSTHVYDPNHTESLSNRQKTTRVSTLQASVTEPPPGIGHDICVDSVVFEDALNRVTREIGTGTIYGLYSLTNPLGLMHPALEAHHFAIIGTYTATNVGLLEFIVESIYQER